jgi:stage III sporulation protein AD
MDVFKICSLAILVLFILIIMREAKSGLVPAARVAVMLVFGGVILVSYIPIYTRISAMITQTPLLGYLPVILRCVGVAMLTQISSDVCREGGEGGLAFCVETVGKMEMLLIALPLVEELIGSIGELLEL